MTSRELDSAGITGPARAGYLIASDLLRTKARERGAPFPIGRLVAPHKRPYLELLFAFITYLDDIVDDRTRGAAARDRRLDRLDAAFGAAVEGEPPPAGAGTAAEDRLNGALMTALVHFMRTWDLPIEEARDYLRFQRGGLHRREYATYEVFEKEYLDPMAPPAIWANTFFERRGAESDRLCRDATVSFQLIDILWDLREDLALGQLMLPLDRLASCGLDREGVERQLERGPLSPALCDVIAAEADRAGRLLESALRWPRTVAPSVRPFVEWDIAINRLKLAELRKGALDDLIRRGVPSTAFRAAAAARTLAGIGLAAAAHRRPRPAGPPPGQE
ncbi:phytoene/squalene synthase family protein [Actinomadura sp. GTD37]|uniref:phytoene/squalene synthase family protein n=1 Tax=Actinomadura sp. GTD37 TaxID=1778030 RepID=UPI0035C06A8C